ncbi:DNA repair protein RecO [Roseovarius autotrophicus]|uniref:DNA repair protein RecO n=1 Tax=Roseovarius autotrophicus TaxID=2824121 RepID=UPI001A095311|nr:DNA repair protein RecO [Roseovarius sp.]
MEWRDQGILLGLRPHGEGSVILEVFTETRGRHAGLVKGGASRRMTPALQPGAQVDLEWRARLEDHLGTFRVEPIRSRAWAMGERLALAGLNAVCGLLLFALPEREAHPVLYRKSLILLDLLDQPEIWPLAYLQWELTLLEEMGFGLDLRTCAVMGEKANDLSYVSPKTGRAVSQVGAGDWADRLLPLPPCLLGQGPAPETEIAQGFDVTGHFLRHHLAPHLGNRALPDARARFVERFNRRVATRS